MTPPLYTLTNVRRVFGQREVLHITELCLETGITYALLGPNGAGKSTLMRLLAFLDSPDSGLITFKGETTRRDSLAAYRAHVVWAPQVPVLFSGSLLYNVEYPMRIRGVPAAERRAKALRLLEKTDLAHLARAPARKLSGGEAQRASIARALATGAEVILFDEPTANVDFQARADIIRIIRELRESRGLCVMVTTHDFDLAAEVCQEHISLFEGRITARAPIGHGPPHPLGAAALPGRLARSGQGFCVNICADLHTARTPPFPEAANSPAPLRTGEESRLTGLADTAAGVVLRLTTVSGPSGPSGPSRQSGPSGPSGPSDQTNQKSQTGQTFEVLLADAEQSALARSLTLGTSIQVLS